jgi:phosphoglycolate phosphatase-like HAD superfamily hydrolase
LNPNTALFSGIRAVLFDLDGTLIDSAPDLGAAADALRIRQGLPSLPLAQYRSRAGSGVRGMLQVAFDMTPEHPRYESLNVEFRAIMCLVAAGRCSRLELF